MPKCGLPAEEPRGESICVGGAAMVNSKPPYQEPGKQMFNGLHHI
jgi:hypothetical protein